MVVVLMCVSASGSLYRSTKWALWPPDQLFSRWLGAYFLCMLLFFFIVDFLCAKMGGTFG